MVDFTLSPSEQHTQAAARRFAATHLASAAAHYSSLPTPEARFQSLRSIYEAAVTAGLLTAQVPAAVGGSSTSLVDAAILVEEFYAVEASASLTIFGTGLGLTPLALAYRPDLHDFLAPFLSGTGSPLASLVFSEPGGVVCIARLPWMTAVVADEGCRLTGSNLEPRGSRRPHSAMGMNGF